jgi:hypothetical protein
MIILYVEVEYSVMALSGVLFKVWIYKDSVMCWTATFCNTEIQGVLTIGTKQFKF